MAEVSARHIHLCQEDLEALFGQGYELKKKKELSLPGMFAAKETVEVVCKDCTASAKQERRLDKVRIVGPVREYTQFEISLSESRKFGERPLVRLSGDLEGTPGFKIIGKRGILKKDKGLIIAKRHIHASLREAEKLGLKHGQEVAVVLGRQGERELIFKKVTVRVAEDYRLVFHIDTDEGNAAGVKSRAWGRILKK